ncbi:MAG: hypothetical protein OXG42_08840 [Chloroflexi bacterium]|nr:hypothetical protein [Chloroflexota bacterium]
MADVARCDEIRAERARLNKLADDMPGKLPPQTGEGPLGRPNPELRRIYDQINDLRKELLALGCKP